MIMNVHSSKHNPILETCLHANHCIILDKSAKMHWGISIISIELTFNFHSYRRQSNASYNFIAC